MSQTAQLKDAEYSFYFEYNRFHDWLTRYNLTEQDVQPYLEEWQTRKKAIARAEYEFVYQGKSVEQIDAGIPVQGAIPDEILDIWTQRRAALIQPVSSAHMHLKTLIEHRIHEESVKPKPTLSLKQLLDAHKTLETYKNTELQFEFFLSFLLEVLARYDCEDGARDVLIRFLEFARGQMKLEFTAQGIEASLRI